MFPGINDTGKTYRGATSVKALLIVLIITYYANVETDFICFTFTFIVSQVAIRVVIKQASGLPPSLSHFVFCQYSVWGGGEPVVVPPHVSADTPPPPPVSPRHQPAVAFRFNHEKDFNIPLTEEFIEHCAGKY